MLGLKWEPFTHRFMVSTSFWSRFTTLDVAPSSVLPALRRNFWSRSRAVHSPSSNVTDSALIVVGRYKFRQVVDIGIQRETAGNGGSVLLRHRV